jgi:hypothetical protein
MRIEDLNRRVLELDDSHPARRFLEAFIDCQSDCLGRELGFDGQTPVDQEWTSATDGRKWTFSGFAYAFLALDFELESFLESAPFLVAETGAARDVPMLRLMIGECAQAARQDGNSEIIELTNQVQQMFDLWDEYVGFRKEMIARGNGLN